LVKKKGASLIVGAASSTGKDFLPRVATLLNAGQASDIIAVNADRSFIRPMYAGDVFAQVMVTTPTTVVTVRSSAFSAATDIGTTGSVHIIAASGLVSSEVGFTFPPSVTVVSQEISGGGRPELADARVIVSGGRALGSAENFEKVLFPLADALNAAIGASRAAVDAGYAPNDWQVGQTGKIVAPDLYIAVGISGAIQHLAGMKDAKIIVAINKDADAPIFELASYGLVGDLFVLVPELTEALKGN
jgi:electron transfer flavoprotein alpha subunit